MAANIRIRSEAYHKARELAALEGKPMTEVLSEAIDDLYRKRFIERANQAYARLRAQSKSWSQELKKRSDWEATLTDGLD